MDASSRIVSSFARKGRTLPTLASTVSRGDALNEYHMELTCTSDLLFVRQLEVTPITGELYLMDFVAGEQQGSAFG